MSEASSARRFIFIGIPLFNDLDREKCNASAPHILAVPQNLGESVGLGCWTLVLYANKCRELFVGVHNKAPSVVAVRVNNPDRSPVGING